MANVKGSAVRNVIYNGKQSLLPPKSPFPSISPSYVDYALTTIVGNRGTNPREGNKQHQRASSENQMEEQPSWLDELLNEPETPVQRSGHRRSSSDSFAYIDSTNGSSIDYLAQDGYKFKNMVSVPSWGSQDFDHYNALQGSFYTDLNPLAKQKNWAWDSSVNSIAAHPSGHPLIKENLVLQISSIISQGDGISSTASEKQDPGETGPNDPMAASEKKDSSLPKCSASETDVKCAKQQFAQRSRVRKLQYIAELERNVQALQAHGSEVSAELEFLNQQNLILSMENKALNQRLESIAQEQLIKYLEHEVLEREIGRLRSLYQLQQQQLHQLPQKPSSRHRRSNSKDLDAQFTNLSLKQKDASSGSDPITSSLHI